MPEEYRESVRTAATEASSGLKATTTTSIGLLQYIETALDILDFHGPPIRPYGIPWCPQQSGLIAFDRPFQEGHVKKLVQVQTQMIGY